MPAQMFLSKTNYFHRALLSSKSLLLVFPATVFLTYFLLLSLLLWLLGQHMYNIDTHTRRHSATHWCHPRHTSVPLAAWLCKLIPLQTQLLPTCSAEVSSVAPSSPAAGHTGSQLSEQLSSGALCRQPCRNMLGTLPFSLVTQLCVFGEQMSKQCCLHKDLHMLMCTYPGKRKMDQNSYF